LDLFSGMKKVFFETILLKRHLTKNICNLVRCY
jgi:hypothetical protein